MFFRVIQHLLFRSRPWALVIARPLVELFNAIAVRVATFKTIWDGVFNDNFADTTRELDLQEADYALQKGNLTEQERRDRLAGAKQEQGGQSPSYLQATLQAAGFDVYIHEWWETPAADPPIARNPFTYINQGAEPVYWPECGEPLAECGEPLAECGELRSGLAAYLLVNKITNTLANYIAICGAARAECGETFAECGEFDGFIDITKQYYLPTDTDRWAYFLYVGGQTFGTLATVPLGRRDEFERLCLKICPTQLWLGMLVQYS